MSASDSGLPQGDRPPPDLRARSAAMFRVPARPLYLAPIGHLVHWFGTEAGLSRAQCEELELAVDEACTNVIRYAFAQPPGGEMTLLFSPRDDGLAVTIQE